MKNLQGIELKRGDQIIAPGDGVSVIMGNIVEFYDRNNQVRVSGYPLRVEASKTVLAKDAYDLIAAGESPVVPKAPKAPKAPKV